MALSLGANNNQGYMDHGDITALNGATALTVAYWGWAFLAVAPGNPDKASFSGVLTNLAFLQTGGESDYEVGDGNVFTTQLWWLRTAANTLETEKWNYLAVTYDGNADAASRVAVYRDLVSLPLTGLNITHPQGTDAASTAPTSLPNTSPNPLLVNSSGVYGLKAHLRMWLAVLTPSELALERERYWASRRTSLLMDCPYDDQLAGRDYSGNGNHGTFVDGPPLQVAGPIPYGGKVLATG